MSTLMECVLSKVRETQNQAALEEVLAILKFEADQSIYGEFTDDQEQLLRESQLEIKQGNSSSHDEVKGRID